MSVDAPNVAPGFEVEKPFGQIDSGTAASVAKYIGDVLDANDKFLVDLVDGTLPVSTPEAAELTESDPAMLPELTPQRIGRRAVLGRRFRLVGGRLQRES